VNVIDEDSKSSTSIITKLEPRKRIKLSVTKKSININFKYKYICEDVFYSRIVEND
jgi:hypothetical protein